MSGGSEREAGRHVLRSLASSTRHNALAYGYSLALTGTFGVLARLDRQPSVGDVFLFAVGAAATFTIASAGVTRGFQVRHGEEPPVVHALGSSLGFLSVSGAIGSAALVGWAASGWIAWTVAPFAASGTYLVLTAFEFGIARVVSDRKGLELEEVDE